MTETTEKICKIAKGFTKVNSIGQKIEERYLTVTGDNLKEVAEEFDKRWDNETQK
jgi:RNA:NAD 2'-phosphotransferase (TPT1/KptA family)